MRLILLTSFTMIAFASNSILTRMAIEPGHIDPFSFSLVRVFAGALFLVALVLGRGASLPWRGRGRAIGAISLTLYMVGFSLAYLTLDAGLGALILFGVVQMSMFLCNSLTGQRPDLRQITGATIAFGGLMLALWPDPEQPGDFAGSFFMALAGIGWAAYTLSGKSARNPLAETAANFAFCLPILLILTGGLVQVVSATGLLLAVLCGAVTSGLGYALWYSVLPDLQRNVAPVVQLSVPIIAILAGSLMLGEVVTASVLAAAVLVILGIALAVTGRSVPGGRS